MYLAFTSWSPKRGMHNIGTPSERLSNVEFQPQWVQKPPTAQCANTSFWGAHLTTRPLSPVSSLKPSGKSSIQSELRTEPGRTTHRNGCPLLASPQAISANSFSSTVAKLPKLTYLAFNPWSAKQGMHIIGTPSQTLSTVEFQPQWLQKPPTASCANTSFCGAHFTMRPLSPVFSSKPSGKSSIHSELRTEPGRITHRNGIPLLASPQAISASSFSATVAKLPKLTYMTDDGACLSSHSMQSASSINKLLDVAGANLCKGPTGKKGTRVGRGGREERRKKKITRKKEESKKSRGTDYIGNLVKLSIPSYNATRFSMSRGRAVETVG
ncbi:hypothetical protein RJ640_015321 [Escallonia rubra]|uniref:Uncharacterized protein n=1 Tax=Escallonia rubra TaxID=112253 RepID=A0AA88R5W3_9ASTE|nr:hypothetical protein RJ640_015321 [Escallonia rubra]